MRLNGVAYLVLFIAAGCAAEGDFGDPNEARRDGLAPSASSGGEGCPAGQARCGGACIDVQADRENCGACGKACAERQVCNAGVCGCLDEPIVEMAAMDLPNPSFIRTDATAVYWVAALAVVKMPKDCGSPTVLAQMTGPGPSGLAIDATHAYFPRYSFGTVAKVPKDGGSLMMLASGQTEPWDTAVDDSYVYWVNGESNSGAVMKVSLEGGSPIVLAADQQRPLSLTMDATHVYWANTGDGTIRKVAKEGGPDMVLAAGQTDPYRPIVDESYVYWINNLWTHSDPSEVRRIPKTGGPVTVLGTGQPDAILGLAIDTANAYWSTADSVVRVPIAGGPPTIVATSPWARTLIVHVDATHVYFSDESGHLFKSVK